MPGNVAHGAAPLRLERCDATGEVASPLHLMHSDLHRQTSAPAWSCSLGPRIFSRFSARLTAGALNFKDAMIASGKLPKDAGFSKSKLGFEFSGLLQAAIGAPACRVMGIAKHAIATRVDAPPVLARQDPATSIKCSKHAYEQAFSLAQCCTAHDVRHQAGHCYSHIRAALLGTPGLGRTCHAQQASIRPVLHTTWCAEQLLAACALCVPWPCSRCAGSMEPAQNGECAREMPATCKLLRDALFFHSHCLSERCARGGEPGLRGAAVAHTACMPCLLSSSLDTSCAAQVWDVPAEWSLRDAATVPVAYLTAYYSLVVRGGLAPAHRVLVHSGTGAVGLAAIRIALHRGCEVFATCGSAQKRRYLLSTFPGLREDHINDSRSTSFEAMVKHLVCALSLLMLGQQGPRLLDIHPMLPAGPEKAVSSHTQVLGAVLGLRADLVSNRRSSTSREAMIKLLALVFARARGLFQVRGL